MEIWACFLLMCLRKRGRRQGWRKRVCRLDSSQSHSREQGCSGLKKGECWLTRLSYRQASDHTTSVPGAGTDEEKLCDGNDQLVEQDRTVSAWGPRTASCRGQYIR